MHFKLLFFGLIMHIIFQQNHSADMLRIFSERTATVNQSSLKLFSVIVQSCKGVVHCVRTAGQICTQKASRWLQS